MKFVHLSDLHLGKRLNDYSLLEDQAYILQQIIGIIDKEAPDGVILAGDIYDKAVPSAEAVSLFDEFLTLLAGRQVAVFVISGNHDSPERIAFGSRIMQTNQVYLSPVYNGDVKPITLTDGYGDTDVYLLPFIKPAHVRRFADGEDINSYTEALRFVIEKMPIRTGVRNILVTHQFVTGATRSDSEEISVGGTDNIDASVFEGFDYVALGHIHSPQNCGDEKIRYCGTPLKYSFSEAKDEKSVTVVEFFEKGHQTVRTVPLVPKHEVVEIKGTYEQLMSKSFYENTTLQEDYVHVTLTDEEDIPDAVSKLRCVYHRLMKLDYDNIRTRTNASLSRQADVEHCSPFDLFKEFYRLQNNQAMSQEQEDYVQALIEHITEGER